MEFTSQPVLVGGFVTGAKRKNRKQDDEGQPIGSEHYESISFIDEASGRAAQMDLDAEVNGKRPTQGARTRLRVVGFNRQVKKARQDGSLYDSRAYDLRVVGFEAAA